MGNLVLENQSNTFEDYTLPFPVISSCIGKLSAILDCDYGGQRPIVSFGNSKILDSEMKI